MPPPCYHLPMPSLHVSFLAHAGYCNTTAGEGLYGQTMEQFGFPALQQMNISTILGMTYFTHYNGISIVLANPKPFVDACVAKVVAFNLSGIDLDYEPQQVSAVVQEMRREGRIDSDADPFTAFLSLMATSLAAHGAYLTIDIGGGCDGQTNNCGAWVDAGLYSKGLLQVNSEDGFGLSSASEFDAIANNDQVVANGGLGKELWAPGFGPGGMQSNTTFYTSILEYAAAQWNVTQIATWAVHEWNVGAQPEWYFDALDAFLATA